jgi:hypothetical protein
MHCNVAGDRPKHTKVIFDGPTFKLTYQSCIVVSSSVYCMTVFFALSVNHASCRGYGRERRGIARPDHDSWLGIDPCKPTPACPTIYIAQGKWHDMQSLPDFYRQGMHYAETLEFGPRRQQEGYSVRHLYGGTVEQTSALQLAQQVCSCSKHLYGTW